MSNNFFGADWHLGHKNILQYNDRPFDNTEEMANAFFEEWEQKVEPSDNVYLVGDICFNQQYIEVFEELPGNKFLIRGNHECRQFAEHPFLWKSSSNLLQIKVEGRKIVLCHYPIEVWNCMEYNALHFHGHCHGNTSHYAEHKENRFDIGYDAVGQALITLDEILEKQ